MSTRNGPLLKKIRGMKTRIISLSKALDELIAEAEAFDKGLLNEPKKTPLATEMVSLSEFAKITGVHYNTVRRWVTDGILIPYALGKKSYFLRGEIPNILKNISTNSHE